MVSDHSFPLHESHIKFKYYLVLQKKAKFVICIKQVCVCIARGVFTLLYAVLPAHVLQISSVDRFSF